MALQVGSRLVVRSSSMTGCGERAGQLSYFLAHRGGGDVGNLGSEMRIRQAYLCI